MTENVQNSFSNLVWHDSKLRSLRISHVGEVDEVQLEVELRGTPGI